MLELYSTSQSIQEWQLGEWGWLKERQKEDVRDRICQYHSSIKSIFSVSFKGKKQKAWLMATNAYVASLWFAVSMFDNGLFCWAWVVSAGYIQNWGKCQDLMYVLTKSKDRCWQTNSWFITSKTSAKVNSGSASHMSLHPLFVYISQSCLSNWHRKTMPVLGIHLRSVNLIHHWYMNPSIHAVLGRSTSESYPSLTTSLWNGRCNLLIYSFEPNRIEICTAVQKERDNILNHKW